jgi:enoyl-CoA hydratase
MTDRYTHYKSLKFARPRPRILEVILSRPGKLNALDSDGHRELAEVWRDIDRDPDTSVACCAARAAPSRPAAISA